MLNYGEGMKEAYDEVKASGLLDKHNIKTLAELKALELELGDKFPGIELEEDTISTLGHYLNRIFTKVEENLSQVTGIKKELDLFGYDLREHVLPGVKLRVGLIDSSSLSADIKKLKEVIDERATEIDIKNIEYKAAVQEALKAAAGMNIVGLAMAIYMGVEAENIRAQRNNLYAEQERDIDILTNKNQTLGSLARVKHDLQSLMIVAIDADVATQNLMHVWNTLYRSVGTSAKSIAEIDDALKLSIFMRQFKEVVTPWEEIERTSDKLIQVFKDADEEYDRNYAAGTRAMSFSSTTDQFHPARTRTMALSMTPDQAYPVLDKALLSNSNQQMRDDRTVAAVWCTKLNYLPHLYDRFNSLVLNVGTSAIQLQECAQGSQYSLESNLRSLANLEADLQEEIDGQGDIELIEELEGERTKLLDNAAVSIQTPASNIKDCLNDISDAFDQRLTQGYLVDFQREDREAKETLEVLGAKLAKLNDERKVIIDAVGAIEKSGIDELGKSIVLTIEKVKALGLAPPEVQLVMFAIEQLKLTMENIGKGIRFLDMVRESNKLLEKIESVSEEINLAHSVVSASAGKTKYILAIHAIESQRKVYVLEYRKAVTAFEQFVASIAKEQFTGDTARSHSFKKEASQFIAFLASASQPHP
jgi:hypothetical protein